MGQYFVYYLIFAAIILLWCICDIKYYEMRDTLKNYDSMHKRIKAIETEMTTTDKNDIERMNQLIDEKAYWETLDKNKGSFKGLLFLKRFFK